MIVEELRRGDRFVAVEPLTGNYGPAEVTILNLSVAGAQISHPQPVRIGTVARLTFHRGDVAVAVQARVIWSHVTPSQIGKLAYRTGVRLEAIDAHYAMGINALLRGGLIRADTASMDRKRQRLIEREEKRKSNPMRSIPSSEPPPS